MKQHGPWRILSSETVYRDPWMEVIRDEVLRPDGEPGTHSVVHIKPGVSVLPMDADGSVHLTDEFHYGIGRHSIEVVSGGIDPGEDPLFCARRELQEELGFQAGDWLHLGTVDPFTSSLVSPTQLYLARGLQFVGTSPEGTEQIRHVTVPLDEAVRMVVEGEITHAPSCVLILKVARMPPGSLAEL